MKRYEVITHCYDSGIDQKENTFTIQEAKALCKYYLLREDYDSCAIYDHKIKKVIALYNGFNQDCYIAADYRNPEAKIFWIEKETI